MAEDGRCGDPPTASGCNPAGYGPGPQLPANAPLPCDAFANSASRRAQAAVDRGRRAEHLAGQRPYRVWLVWQERTTGHEWREVTRLELVPVRVSGIADLDVTLASDGAADEGRVLLREISPNQVDEATLRGTLRGIDFTTDSSEREFFYEVQQHPACVGDELPKTYRFARASAPEYDAKNFGWKLYLYDQRQDRTPTGADVSIPQSVDEPDIVP